MGVEVDSRRRTEAEAGLTRLLAELFCADSTYRELMSSPLLAHLKQSMPGEGSSPLRRAEALVELLSHRGMVDDAFFLAVQGVAAGRRKEIERIRRLLHPPSAPPQALYSPAPPSSWSSAARPGLPALLLLGSTMGVLTVAVQWDTSSGALVTITAGDAAPAAGPGRREIHSVQILDALREIAIEEPDYSVLDLTRATHAATNGKLEFSAFAIDTELVSFEAFASWRAQTHTRPTRAEQHARDEGARRARGMPWGDARQYCLDRNGDLPSQFQWEIMARNLADSRGDPTSQTGTLYPWGDEWSESPFPSSGVHGTAGYAESPTDDAPNTVAFGLREWMRDDLPGESDRRLVRGASHQLAARIWTMGHVLAQPVEPLGWSDVGFRCVQAEDARQMRETVGRHERLPGPPMRQIHAGFYGPFGAPRSPVLSATREILLTSGPVALVRDLAPIHQIVVMRTRPPRDEVLELLSDLSAGRASIGTTSVLRLMQGPILLRTQYCARRINPGRGAGDMLSDPGSTTANFTWWQAACYCAMQGMRLPTNTEWNLIARDGSTFPSIYPWGDEPDGLSEWLNVSHPVDDLWAGGPEWILPRGTPEGDLYPLKGPCSTDCSQCNHGSATGISGPNAYIVAMIHRCPAASPPPQTSFRCVASAF